MRHQVQELMLLSFPLKHFCDLLCRLSELSQSTAWPHYISGFVLSSHSVVSSSRTVRPVHWEIDGLDIGGQHGRRPVCSSAPHAHVAEGAIRRLCKQERKRPRSVWRWLSRIYAVLDRAIQGGWTPMSGMKERSLVVLSNHSVFLWWELLNNNEDI